MIRKSIPFVLRSLCKAACIFNFGAYGVALGGFPPPAIVPEADVLVATRDVAVPFWDSDRVEDLENPNVEFPHLIRFGDHWYCSFREGLRHGNHISGQGRLMRSADGLEWETVTVFEAETGDVRDPRLSVTADGQLMVNASIYYFAGDEPLEIVDGVTVQRRSVTWLSQDGVAWSGPYACPTGINTWRWDVAWHDGYGYSAGYSGKDSAGTLYRTADGKTWEVVLERFFPRGGTYNEAALTFDADGVGYCILRGGRGGSQDAMLGVGHPPYDSEWTWRSLNVVWQGSEVRRPFTATGARNLGGPTLITLQNGDLLGAARMMGVKIFAIDPEEATLTILIDVQGGSYPGLAEHEGDVWFTNTHSSKGPVVISRARIPGRMTVEDLNRLADDILGRELHGFGKRYQEKLNAARAETKVDGSDRMQRSLHAAIVRYQRALALRTDAEAALAANTRLTEVSVEGFGRRAQNEIFPALSALESALRDDQTEAVTVAAAIEVLTSAVRNLQAALTLKAAAGAALTEADGVLVKSLNGFESLYQNAIRQRSDALRELLNSDTASAAAVSADLDQLRHTLGRYLEVTNFPAAPVIEVGGMPASITIDERLPAGSGLLVNTRADGSGLTLNDMPVLAFAGSRSGVNFGNPSALAAIHQDITISVWAWENGHEAYRTILAKGHGPSGHDGFYLRHGRVEQEKNPISMGIFGLDEPHDPYVHSHRPRDPHQTVGRWSHYAYTFDGAEFNLYLNGERIAGEVFDSKGSKGIDLSTGDLTAGHFANAAGGRIQPWYGYIKDVRIRNRTLSAEQIRDEMDRLPLANEPDLVGYWPMNEGMGDRSVDHSGHANDGEIRTPEWLTVVARRGYRLSGPFYFKDAHSDSRYSLRWSSTGSTGDGASVVTMRLGFSANASTLPAKWQEVENGSSVDSGTSSIPFVWVIQELVSNDASTRPKLEDVMLAIGK